MNRQIIRVFPRRTAATPKDELTFIGDPPFPSMIPRADAIHISVTFSWDMREAERLAEAWSEYGIVLLGGPATGTMGGDFIPGRYVAPGYVITSRGCPNRCWFCDVWKREGDIRELPLTEGKNILDSNLLACSEHHIRAVFDMLQGKYDVRFTGGLEAARLKPWHIELLKTLKSPTLFFAYDTPDDLEPLFEAGKMLKGANFSNRGGRLRAYVLIGFPKDSFERAETRLEETIKAGFMPMAMLWRDKKGDTQREWRKFQRLWARPAIMGDKMLKW